jgi:serine/threonine-protein kinase
MENTLVGKIRPPSEFRPVPESLSAVVSRSMEVKQENRYSSVNQLRNEVLKYQTGYSTSAENAGFAKEFSLFVKRNRTACLVGTAAILILFIVCLLFIQNLQLKAAELKARSLELKDKKDALEEKNDEALEAKRIAEEHRKRADFVADQFELEKIESGKLVNDLSRQYQQEASSMVGKFIYTEPVISVEKSVNALRKVIDLDPENNEPYDKLVYSLFIMHDFEEILKYRGKFKTGHRNEDIFTASEKYKGRQTRKKLLKVEDFREMLADLSVSGISTGIKRTHLSEKMLAYYLQKKGGQTNTIEGIKGVLKTWNPDWDFSGFDYNSETKELYVRSKYLKIFTYVPLAASGKCILRYLDIKNLILTNSGIYDLKQINDLKISVLDIRGTKINSLSALSKMGMLKSLIISRNQFPMEELESLPVHVKVFVKKR